MTSPRTLRERVAHRPATAFVAAACALSWLIGWPLQSVIGEWVDPLSAGWLFLTRLPVVAGPALAAVGVVLCVGGRAGGRDWVRSLWPSASSWSFAFGCSGVVLLLGVFAAMVSGPPIPWGAVAGIWPQWLFHLCGLVLVMGLLEEVGWRGWLLPHLLSRQRPLEATLAVTAGWALWHLPGWWQFSVTTVLALLLLCGALSFLLTVVYLRSRSVPACALVHGCANAPLYLVPAITPDSSVVTTIACGGAALALLSAAMWRRQT